MAVRVIVAALVGLGVAALAMLALTASGVGFANASMSWGVALALGALLGGSCVVGLSVAYPRRKREAAPAACGLVASAIVWGVGMYAVTDHPAGQVGGGPYAPLPAPIVGPLAVVGYLAPLWLVIFAALAGIVAGGRPGRRVMRRALTPLWPGPLWGLAVGGAYGLLAASRYVGWCPRSYPPSFHCYGLEIGRWDALRAGLSLGGAGGLALGVALALALVIALFVAPLHDVAHRVTRDGASYPV